MHRCAWVPPDDPLYARYHDREWGVPVYDDVRLFEFLCLEGAQAGLSWRTILHRREDYRRAFAGFVPAKVAAFSKDDIERLMLDRGIVRNRLKLEAAVENARRVLAIQERSGSFSDYLWALVGGAPQVNHWARPEDVPAETDVSKTLSRTLRREGLRFVGPTICYAFMQATGMVMDHVVDCFRHDELAHVHTKER